MTSYRPTTGATTALLLELLTWSDDAADSETIDRRFDELLCDHLRDRGEPSLLVDADETALRQFLRSPDALQLLVYSGANPVAAEAIRSRLARRAPHPEHELLFGSTRYQSGGYDGGRFRERLVQVWQTAAMVSPCAARLITDSLRVVVAADADRPISSSDTPGLIQLAPHLSVSDTELLDLLLLEAMLAAIWRVEAIDQWWGTDHARNERELVRSPWSGEWIHARSHIIRSVQWFGYLSFWKRARAVPALADLAAPRIAHARSGFGEAGQLAPADAAGRWGLSDDARRNVNRLPEAALEAVEA